jgi:hypothetical protein
MSTPWLTIECGARGGSSAWTLARPSCVAPAQAQPSVMARSSRTGPSVTRCWARSAALPSTSTIGRGSISEARRSGVGSPPGSDQCRRRSGGITPSNALGCSRRWMPASRSSCRKSAGSTRASNSSVPAPGQAPTYTSRTGAPANRRRTYRAVATGGETVETRNGVSSDPVANNRRETSGQAQKTAGAASRAPSWRRHSVATSSSPQLAGTAVEKPALRQACASCTGVAGRAANAASAPMTATAGGPEPMSKSRAEGIHEG